MSDLVNTPKTMNAMQYYATGASPVIAPPETESGDIPAEDFQPAADIPADQFQQGSAPSGTDIPAEDFKPKDYSTPGQQALTALEGIAQGVLGPLAPAAEIASRLTTAQDIAGREAESPYIHGGFKGAGFLGSAVLGTGEAALLGKVGQLATDALGLSGKIAPSAIRWATEAGLLSAGDEVTKQILSDPATASQTAMVDQPLSNILGNIAVGGGLGAMFGAASPLLAKAGPKVAQFLEDMKGSLAGGEGGLAPRDQIANEGNVALHQAEKLLSGTFGDEGTKMKAIRAAVKPMHEGIADQINALREKVGTLLAKNEGNPEFNTLRRYAQEFDKQVLAPEVSQAEQYLNPVPRGTSPKWDTIDDSGDLFAAANKMKQALQDQASASNYGALSPQTKDYINQVGGLASQFKNALEDTAVWGKAGNIQSTVNKATAELLKPLSLFKSAISKATTNEAGQAIREADPDMIETLLNKVRGGKGDIKVQNINQFYKKLDNIVDAVNGAYGVTGESMIEPASRSATDKFLNNYSLGNKVGDILRTKGLESFGNTLASLAGSHFGFIGSYLSKEALGPSFAKLASAIGEPLLNKLGNGEGARAASQYVESVHAGNNMIANAAKNLFKAGAQVLPLSAIPTVTRRARLDKQLLYAQNHPEQFADAVSNNKLGYYMPEQAASAAQALGNTVNYVNGLRPDTSPKSPLDTVHTPSQVKQAAFQNALTLAEQPAMILHKVKEGTITADDIKHVNATSPAAYQQMQKEVANNLAAHIARGGHVPYKTRIGLSLFMGQPMDSTFVPSSIMAAQPISGAAQTPPQQKARGATRGGTTKNLGKLAQQAMTPAQARQNHGNKE